MTTLHDLIRFIDRLRPAGPEGAPSADQWIGIMLRSAIIRRHPDDGLFVCVALHNGRLSVIAYAQPRGV